MNDFYPSRYVCEVLEEMRKCFETRNFAYILGLIEEVQTLVNRMEAKLEDYKSITDAEERKESLKKELKELRKKIKEESKES